VELRVEFKRLITTNERLAYETQIGSPASTNALIDESDGNPHGATLVRADNRTEEVAGQIRSS
jgi:hypothetical protein